MYLFETNFILIFLKAAFHPCVNVYIYKPINRSEWRSYVPWVIKSKAKLINNKKKVSTDRASMILRKHEQSVFQSLCSIYQHFFGFVYFIICNSYIYWKCAKLKKIKAQKLEISYQIKWGTLKESTKFNTKHRLFT